LGKISFENKKYEWATDFDGWLSDVLLKNTGEQRESLLSKFEQQKSAKMAHPRTEHLIPLLIPATIGGTAKKIHSEWTFGLSLACYEFE
jgi:aromatic ring-opening dioxygenase catalytic subunit (LigB family)